MKVLLIGVGGVGEAIAKIAQERPWLERMVLADYNRERVRAVYGKLHTKERFVSEWIDAGNQKAIEKMARKYNVDLIMNAVESFFNYQIFNAAYEAGCTYVDLALSLTRPHPTDPFHQCGVKLGDDQFAQAERWEKRGLLALLGMGVDPGMSDVFARYAEKHLFDDIDEIGVRDGANLQVQGYEFAPNFSVWDTIEECTNPPVIWEHERGWYTTEPFSEPEVFEFPEDIGKVECVNVEHEEVVLIPRWVRCKRVTFKFGLDRDFINVLKVIKMTGLDNKEPINVKGVEVAPRDVVAACLPDPARLGDRMSGKTCAGTWVKGEKDGQARQVYIHQVTDNATCMHKYGVQAVVWQTAVNPVIAMELLETGIWRGKGVLGPEAFDPDPFMEMMPKYNFPYGIKEM